MAVPKKKTSKSKRNMRRSHDALTASNPVVCPNCGNMRLRHRACVVCGTYKGHQIINIKAEKESE